MHTRSIVALAALALVALPARAQLGNPGMTDPATAEARPGTPAPGETNPQDRLFLKLAAMGNLGEVEAGHLALTKSSNPRVQAFARQMTEDHSATREKLDRLARDRRLPAPTTPQPDQQAARQRLESLSGRAFDAAYLETQLVDHQKTVQLLEWEIGSGQDAAVQQLAKDTLPAVLEHLRQVQTLMAETTGAPPQGLATMPMGAGEGRR